MFFKMRMCGYVGLPDFGVDILKWSWLPKDSKSVPKWISQLTHVLISTKVHLLCVVFCWILMYCVELCCVIRLNV